MQAGRAAFARQGFNNARPLFSQILNDKPPYPDLVAEAYFAYGDCLMMEALGSTNVLANYGEASKAFRNITRQFGTNEVVPKAWGNLGNCFLQLARQEAAYYSEATNAFTRVLAFPNASVTDRSQALVGIGIALAKLADTYSTPKDQQALQEQAQASFLRVVYEKNLLPGEKPDPFWQKKAGLEAAQLAEQLQDWNAALGTYERLKQILPPLGPELDRRIARIRSRPAAEKP
jgi:tetratricopeptide (TPR) repeat protein